jgi:hypothetical protein
MGRHSRSVAMKRSRVVTTALLFNLVWGALPARAHEAAPIMALRDLLETRRIAKTAIVVELEDGVLLRGLIGRTTKTTFDFVSRTQGDPRRIRYADVRALIDPMTDQRLIVQQVPGPTGRMSGGHPSLKQL